MEKQQFLDALPEIIDNLMASPKLLKLPEVANRIIKVLEYNLKGSELIAGLMTKIAYEMFEKPENITEEKLKLTRVLGWCAEMAVCFFNIIDDILDGSTMRQGATCWYLMPNIGMGAINDSILISYCITEILEIYFINTPQFVDIIRGFHEAILITTMGLHLDFLTANHAKNNDYSKFTIQHWKNSIVPYKTGFFGKLPILFGLTLVKDVDMKIYYGIDEIYAKLGHVYQMKNDYTDCFDEEAGKPGTDIQERRCTWLAVTALQHCNEAQKELFVKHYGSRESKDVAVIKRLYDELQIPELYKQKEKELYNDLVRSVNALPLVSLSKYYSILIEKCIKKYH